MFNSEKILKDFSKITKNENIKKNADMRKYTSFQAGGAADILIEPQSGDELIDCVRYAFSEKLPYFIMGNGSNLLISDEGYRGIVIKVGAKQGGVIVRGNALFAQAGALMSEVAAAAADAELTGIEFAGGIPGSIGGAVFMNAGAYDGEMKNVISSVTVYSSIDGYDEPVVKKSDELELSYRHSIFQNNDDLIFDVMLILERGDEASIRNKMKEFRKRRTEKQPLSLPSAGSTFKRPEGNFAGKLIDEAGLRGLSLGGAQVSELHSGFIVNKGGATATDIISLMKIVKQTVFDKSGVMLEPEVRIIGENNED